MIKLKKIKVFFKKFFWAIGKNFFPSLFILIFLSLIFGGFIYYQYSFLIEKKEPQIIEIPLHFKESLYQKILNEWQIHQEKFETAEFKEYRNLFSPPVSVEELTE